MYGGQSEACPPYILLLTIVQVNIYTMHTLSLYSLQQALRKRWFSCVELTQHLLQRIYDNTILNAFISVHAEQALKDAAQADIALKALDPRPLLGIPIAHKDIFYTTQGYTTAGSKLLEHFQAPYNADIVTNLSQQGTILLGKTNLDAFAMGSTNTNSDFGPVKNPWNLDCIPGGSSGGSAASVAAKLTPFATGSDTGGSVRQPAALCGVVGFKPTFAKISTNGMIYLAPELDHVGFMANSVADLAFMFANITHTTTQIPPPQPLSFKFSYPTCYATVQTDASIAQTMQAAIKKLIALGGEYVELNLSTFELFMPCYKLLACIAAAKNLNYYLNLSAQKSMHDIQSHLGTEVNKRIHLGIDALRNKRELQAQRWRQDIIHDIHTAFTKVDIILSPSTPNIACDFNKLTIDNDFTKTSDIFLIAANLTGLPALTIPIGFHQGLPIGMHLMGQHGKDAQLLAIACAYEEIMDFN